MPVTIEDVAKSAGVSTKTVSRVVNWESNVADDTRYKVLSTIEALGYRPNPSAQHLARGRAGLIGVLIHDATPSYVLEVLNGLLEIGNPRGYRVSLQPCDINEPHAVEGVIRMAAQHQIDGLIFTPPCDQAALLVETLHTLRFPFIMLTPHERTSHYAWVAATDEQGAFEITRHLLELGHRCIGFVQGNSSHQASWDRLNGFRRAFQTYGLETDSTLIVQGSWTFESGLECAMRLLDSAQRPSAIVAANDEVAAGVIQMAWRLGIACPAQLSVVGFDDVPLAQQLCPPLTTVSQPIREIARIAMTMLIEQLIPDSEDTRGIVVPTTLVVRQSTTRLADR
ncbi:MAG: LacI family DNA-binding transcriptional regulator [Chloroflexi bacterium]|nr:LacI family DNA-binding transcriptional regulator [Chloroflexota bacterium]